MPLYLVPALDERDSIGGINPDLPEGVGSWAGIFNEPTMQYVIQTEEPIEGLKELAVGADVGFDYSGFLPKQSIGAIQPDETDANAGEVSEIEPT